MANDATPTARDREVAGTLWRDCSHTIAGTCQACVALALARTRREGWEAGVRDAAAVSCDSDAWLVALRARGPREES